MLALFGRIRVENLRSATWLINGSAYSSWVTFFYLNSAWLSLIPSWAESGCGSRLGFYGRRGGYKWILTSNVNYCCIVNLYIPSKNVARIRLSASWFFYGSLCGPFIKTEIADLGRFFLKSNYSFSPLSLFLSLSFGFSKMIPIPRPLLWGEVPLAPFDLYSSPVLRISINWSCILFSTGISISIAEFLCMTMFWNLMFCAFPEPPYSPDKNIYTVKEH